MNIVFFNTSTEHKAFLEAFEKERTHQWKAKIPTKQVGN